MDLSTEEKAAIDQGLDKLQQKLDAMRTRAAAGNALLTIAAAGAMAHQATTVALLATAAAAGD